MTKAEKTKRLIVEKTAPVFNRKGFAGTTLNDMTEATGLTKGSIYGNFASKDEVALAAFDYNFKYISAAIQQRMEEVSSCKDKLLVYADFYENLLNDPRTAAGCAVLNTATEADDTHPELRKKAASAFNSWKNNIVSLIRKGSDNREFTKVTDPEAVAITLISTIEGGIMIAKLTGKPAYMKIVANTVRKVIGEL